MESKFVDEEIKYIGSQLAPHWIYKNFGICGDAIVSFIGEMDVKLTEMVDIEDVLTNSPIYSKKMVSFILEHFEMPLAEAVSRQRLLICIIIEELRKLLNNDVKIRRSGDDIFVNDAKLSVSIATKSTTSSLIHIGLNINSEGAPVKACGLENDLGITCVKEFAKNIMTRYIEEDKDIHFAVCKVRGVLNMVSKNSQRKAKQTIALFIITFLITLIGVTYLIKSFSPNVDVEIGGEELTTETGDESDEPESDFKKAIDDRLKWIQLEDNMPGVSKRGDEEKSEEVEYETAKTTANQENSAAPKKEEPAGPEITLPKANETEYVNPQNVRTAPPIPKPAAVEPYKMTKVYVGSYATIEQAIQAQNHLMNAPIGISPFVKEVNGSYVLQAGSFASAAKAESIANQIRQAGFSARVVSE